jgi:hypothetical protein
VLGRLRNAGYNVIDRSRPRCAGDDGLSVNHGGIVVISAADVSLSPINDVNRPTTFEMLCVRAVTGRFSATVVVIYRPGSTAVSQKFFDELAVVLDRVAIYQEPIYVVGDMNIRLDRCDDHDADQLRLLVDCYGLVLHDTVPTHQLGGTLDVVISHGNVGRPASVSVEDVGLSDHFLLRWEASAIRPTLNSVTIQSRQWSRLDMDHFRSAISTSRLCQPDTWPTDIDDMAVLYDDELNRLLDQLLPLRQFVRRPRPSDPYFDKECRDAKRLSRRLERAYAAACRQVSATAAESGSSRSPDEATATAMAAKEAWYNQRRLYRQLRRHKSKDFWRKKIDADQADPRKLWRSVDDLLGRGRLPASSAIDVEALSRYFTEKVEKVRSSTSDAPPPTFSHNRSGVSFSTFSPVNVDDVIIAVRRLPDKSSAADPMPTAVMKQVADLIAPYIAELFNRSLTAGHFPAVFKEAFITPIIKKAGLDTTDVSSYRPISNLSVLSKLLERLVVRQLMEYLTAADLLPTLQSGFRPGHSTETAVLQVLSELLEAVDRGDLGILILLDLSAAFDTVDHDILLQRLRLTFGVHGITNRWFQSYLHGRTQYVRRGATRSSTTRLLCGVPQGSVLGPVLFILYTMDLILLIEQHDMSPHLYADDTQIGGSCRPNDVNALSSSIAECTSDVASWMRSNRLQLNSSKTEVLWCATNRRRLQLPTSALLIDGVTVDPVTSVRDLGIFIDADLVMKTHVQRTVSRCFAVLRQLRQIRHLVPPTTFQTLVVVLVLSRLDYGNGVLIGLPAYLVRRLQSVLNASARLICHLRRSDHITDVLVNLHWLRVPERIQYKIAVLTYKVLHGTAPRYLGPLTRVVDLPGRRCLRSASSDRLVVPPYKLSTIGSRTFKVASAQIWNGLPEDVTSSPTLSSFRRRLKTYLFRLSYPDFVSH